MDAHTLATFALNGVVLGAIIALAAVGLTLVYGILRLSNFAHGDTLTLGAYVVFAFQADWSDAVAPTVARAVALALAAWVALDRLRWRRLLRHESWTLLGAALLLGALAAWPAWGSSNLGHGFVLSLALAAVFVPAFMLACDALIWRRLRKQDANTVTFIITSIGLALVIRHALAQGFGGQLRSYDRPAQEPLHWAGFTLTWVQLLTIGVAAVAIGALHVLLKYTRTGRSLRAVSDNMELARVTGIDVPRMITYVWIIAGVLAALAGVLLALNVNVNPNLGWNLILPVFAAVILGGIGSPYGAMLGALVIAMAMEISVAWAPEYRLATGFLVLIAVMLWRPQGILGVKR